MYKRIKILTDLCIHYKTEYENDYVKTSFLYLNFNSVLFPEKYEESYINYRLMFNTTKFRSCSLP